MSVPHASIVEMESSGWKRQARNQFWLGETFYAQGDYRQAAKNFLAGYKNYPKSRRAPDSLLKLGISLNKLGQTQQACASFGALGGQYPNAVDAKKRAQAEFKRAAC